MIVLHVVEPNHVAEQPIYLGQQTIQYSVVERDRGDRLLQRQLRKCYVPELPLEVEYHTQEGDHLEMLSSADELACDLIVMGTHGRTGLDRLLTGSVAEAVLRKARCPVLALRSPNHWTAMPEASDEAMLTPGTTWGPEHYPDPFRPKSRSRPGFPSGRFSTPLTSLTVPMPHKRWHARLPVTRGHVSISCTLRPSSSLAGGRRANGPAILPRCPRGGPQAAQRIGPPLPRGDPLQAGGCRGGRCSAWPRS